MTVWDSEWKRREDWDKPVVTGRMNLRPEGYFPPSKGPSQGQILTGGHTHPWPRGFNPKRAEQVGEALDEMTVESRGRTRGYSMPGKGDEFSAMSAKVKTRILGKQRDIPLKQGVEGFMVTNRVAGNLSQQFHNKVFTSIATSSIPAPHLRGLDEIVEMPIHDATGEYKYAGSDQGLPQIAMADNPEDDADFKGTLIHELGHHVSSSIRTSHSAYDTPAKQGQEEGFADRYAANHGDPEWRSGYNSPGMFPQHMGYGSGLKWRIGYERERDLDLPKNLSTQFHQLQITDSNPRLHLPWNGIHDETKETPGKLPWE